MVWGLPLQACTKNADAMPLEMDLESIKVGYKLPIKKDMSNNLTYQQGEILGIKDEGGARKFYVHYVDFNKRLDEWVDGSCLKLDNILEIEVPKKKRKSDSAQKKEQRESDREKRDSPSTRKEGGRSMKSAVQADEELYKIKNVQKIQIGKFLIEAWYFSPYPELVATSEVVYICEFCLFYFSSLAALDIHSKRCLLRHPPGNEIYRCNELSFFELDGHMQKNYCRNLSLLSKLFLDHKTLYYDIDVFMFYVLCKYTSTGYHILGYFSKEKNSEHGYNLACILTLPHEQRKGYGKVLMDFSYLLSRKEGKIASPEKPLSDLGLLGYRSYWKETIVDLLRQVKKISIKEISAHTSITEEDVVGTLAASSILQFYNGVPTFILSEKLVEKNTKACSYRVDPGCLKWEIPKTHHAGKTE